MSSHDPNNPYSNQPPYGGQQAYGQQPPYGSQPYDAQQQQYGAGAQQPYGGQQAYGSQPFPGQMPPYGAQGGQMAQYQATKDAQTSWILGLVGLFITMGIVLGPIAIHYANKAERGGAKATLGRVLGWLCIIEFILAIVAVIAFVAIAMANQN